MMQRHVRIGDRTVPIHSWRVINGRRVPVVKCDSDETRHPDGRVDVTIRVPCLHVAADAGKEDNNG